MRKRKFIAVAVAVALQSYYAPAMAAADNDEEEKCPTNISSLSKEERAKLSATCLAVLAEKDNHWGWVAGGIAALATGVAIGIENNGGHSHHHSSSPVPPDDGGDDNVIPPDDGGDDDVIPPDDGGDDDDDKDTTVITFSNGVTLDKGKDTLHFADIKLNNGKHLGAATLSYAKENNLWQLKTADGKTLDVSGWNITADNAAVIEGTQENGLYWKYDSRGYLILADETTQVIAGNGATNATDRGMDISGKDKTGVIISGDGTTNTLSGDSTVSDGATGGKITGDDATVDNKGNTTVSGEGSMALYIDGDDAFVINEGTQDISAGAISTRIDGDNARIINTGDVKVDGAGSTNVLINGDDAQVTQAGYLNVTNSAHGIEVNGDRASITNNGDINVQDEGSKGILVTGDETTYLGKGDIYVAKKGVGLEIQGEDAVAENRGNIYTTDAGSTGVLIDGDSAQFTNSGSLNVSTSSTGAQINGAGSTVTLDGSVNVRAVSDDGLNAPEGLRFANGNGYIGVNINAENTQEQHGSLLIDGDVNVSSERDNPNDWPGNAGEHPAYGRDLAGVMVNGSFNDVRITGEVNVSATPYHADLASGFSKKGDKYQDNVTGIVIDGQNNTAVIDGGVHVSSAQTTTDWTAAPLVTGIDVSGENNRVILNGDSSVTANSGLNANVAFANISDGASMYISEDATLTIDAQLSAVVGAFNSSGIIALSNQAALVNDGNISGNYESLDFGSIIYAQDSVFINGEQGSINIDFNEERSTSPVYPNAVLATDSLVDNKGTISITSDNVASMDRTGVDAANAIDSSNSPIQFGAIEGTGNSTILNEGEISASGGNTWGIITVSDATANNTGTINHEGVWKDKNGNPLNCNSDRTRCFVALGGGMAATDSTTGANNGVINVVNAGIGMWANGSGSTVINQGEINLTSNEKVGSDTPYLVGMAALNGGMAVNDATGVINIDASYGQAFYTDSSSLIINYGTICIDGVCQDSDQYNPTDSDVTDTLRDGDIITGAGKTRSNETIVTDPMATDTIHITNAGTVSGGKLMVNNYANVTNESTGSISNVSINKGGVYTNNGTTAKVSVDGGVFNNTGTVTGKTGTTVGGSVINNSGTMKEVEQWSSTMNNTGLVSSWTGASGSAVLNNNAGGEVDKITFTAASTVNNAGMIKNGFVDKGGTLNNLEGGVITLKDNGLWSGAFNNWGTVNGDADIATGGSGHTLYNGSTGVINGQITTSKNNGGSKAINDGAINIDKTGNVAMSAHGSAKMVNNGTINVGTEGTVQTGMVGMQLESDAKANAVIENNGTINIYASNSYAFSKLGSNGHIVNNGTVYIDDSVTGSGLIKQEGKNVEGSGEGGDGVEVHYVNFTAPTEPTIDDGMTNVATGDDASASSSTTNDLSGYVVGTSADGSVGKLMVSNASMSGVEINTGFTAGTADTSVTFDNVVQGSNLSDADAIQSTSVVWNAQGSQDSDGNVDVTMTKNAYADVATDSSVSDVAQALDAGYTNNELYTSLNVGTTAELNRALKQISGSQATTVFREARVLSNRFNMLADAAPQIKNGLAFNVVAKGDPRAELGNETRYDMLALRQTLDLTASQNLTLEYGIARLDGNGTQNVGDNGLTGGYSQFFGLKHSMAFEGGLTWNNALRYDVHNLDSSRSVSYDDVNKVADADTRQQYLEFRSEGAITFSTLNDMLKVTPYAGVKLRHTLEGGYKERSAGDFNLSMNSGSETAVDSIVGLKLDYAGNSSWSASATLEGGPNLSYSKSQRIASLQGAAGQSFNVDDDQKGDGVNGLATVGVKYSSNDTALHLDAYQWKEDGISDKGFMLNFKKTFR